MVFLSFFFDAMKSNAAPVQNHYKIHTYLDENMQSIRTFDTSERDKMKEKIESI